MQILFSLIDGDWSKNGKGGGRFQASDDQFPLQFKDEKRAGCDLRVFV